MTYWKRKRARSRAALMRRVLLIVGSLGPVLGLVQACGSSATADGGMGGATAGAGGMPSPEESGGASAGPADGGGDMGGLGGAGGQGGEPLEPCDPFVDDCSRHLVLHVSPRGDDDTSGTALAPLRTLGEALARVAMAVEEGEEFPLIYLCSGEGAYEETLSVGPEHGAVGIFGGFECEFFTTYAERAVLVAHESSGHRIEDASGITLGDLELESPAADPDAYGESSIALTVVESTGVRILRSELIAGAGAPGAHADGYPADEPAETGEDGNEGRDACTAAPGQANLGGPAAVTICGGVSTVSIGGDGGPGGALSDGSQGLAGEPDGGAPGAGAGEIEGTSVCSSGGNGQQGLWGDHGEPSARVGALGPTGYVPPTGGAGMAGTIGEGGGGGGGAAKPEDCATGASGGSGGGGGCPGAGAAGGQGGGGSFGLVSVNSEVELADVSVEVAIGGQGGNGGNGQLGGDPGEGADGGTPGDSWDGNDACQGGNGGRGGHGGSGAGGAGGPSIGVAHVGAAPAGHAEINLPSKVAAGGLAGLYNLDGDGPTGQVAALMEF